MLLSWLVGPHFSLRLSENLSPHHHSHTAHLSVKCVCLFVCCPHLQVKLSVFLDYVRSLTWYMAFLILLFNVLTNGMSVGGNFWLAAWSDREGSKANISGAETCV